MYCFDELQDGRIHPYGLAHLHQSPLWRRWNGRLIRGDWGEEVIEMEIEIKLLLVEIEHGPLTIVEGHFSSESLYSRRGRNIRIGDKKVEIA